MSCNRWQGRYKLTQQYFQLFFKPEVLPPQCSTNASPSYYCSISHTTQLGPMAYNPMSYNPGTPAYYRGSAAYYRDPGVAPHWQNSYQTWDRQEAVSEPWAQPLQLSDILVGFEGPDEEKFYQLSAIRYGGAKGYPRSHFFCFELFTAGGDPAYFYPIKLSSRGTGPSQWHITSGGLPFKDIADFHMKVPIANIRASDFSVACGTIQDSRFYQEFNDYAVCSELWALSVVKNLVRAHVLRKSELEDFEDHVEDTISACNRKV